MKPAVLRILLLLAFLPSAAFAQLTMVVQPGADTVIAGSQLSYTITLINQEFGQFQNQTIASQFPTNTVVSQATAPTQSSPGVVAFLISNIAARSSNTLSLTLRPLRTGLFTNTFTLNTTPPLTTNIVTTVITGTADLSVSVTGIPTGGALTNDVIAVAVRVENRGPNSAPSVVVTNTMPVGSVVLALNIPSNTTVSPVTNSGFNWNIGALAASASVTLTATLRLPTPGTFSLAAGVQSSGNSDPTDGNNSVSNNLSVQAHITDTLQVTRGTQTFNRNTALFEEVIGITNIGSGTSPGARLMVSNLVAPDRLYLVNGTNGTTPYILSIAPLAPRAGLTLTNYYFFQNRSGHPFIAISATEAPGSTNQYVAAPIGAAAITLTTNSNQFSFSVGTTPGRSYQVQASDNAGFLSNNFVFQPTIIATNFSLLITDNPAATNRFFRAIENP